jgi:hypothetical protein
MAEEQGRRRSKREMEGRRSQQGGRNRREEEMEGRRRNKRESVAA